MRNGVLLIDKPAGVTSAGVVARVKKVLKASKVGHAGTLDPDATGLLVCLINGATRVAPFASEGTKVYSGILRLGLRTSTDDITGEVISECSESPSFAAVQEAASTFIGTQMQLPPRVSAKKVQGRRAHDLERRGIDFVLEPRQVTIHSLDVWHVDAQRVGYRMSCSPGTYVRALARDLGERLGCGAVAETIRREASGPLHVDSGCALEQIGWERVQDWALLVPDMPRVVVPPDTATALRQGRMWALSQVERLPAMLTLKQRPGVFIFAEAADQDGLGLLHVDEAGVVTHRANLCPL